jgi:endoribonuclease Dicer
MLINERFRMMSSPKVIIFLAPKRSLVEQQVGYIQRHMELPNIKVNGYTGLCLNKFGMQIDTWSPDDWMLETATYQVLVLTPELLKNALHRSVLSLTSIDTIIFDECQHARGKAPMAEICRYLDRAVSFTIARPKILGLTATGMNSKRVCFTSIFLSTCSFYNFFWLVRAQLTQVCRSWRRL